MTIMKIEYAWVKKDDNKTVTATGENMHTDLESYAEAVCTHSDANTYGHDGLRSHHFYFREVGK